MSTIKISGIPSYILEYTGKPITFKGLEVTYDDAVLAKDTDYTVTCFNNINPGIGAIVIQGIGNYDFRRDISFTIINNNPDSDDTVEEAGPYSDISFGQTNILHDHEAKINAGNYSEAMAALDAEHITAFRAGAFNSIQEKLRYTQEYLYTKKDPVYYEYSQSEPGGDSTCPLWRQEYETDPSVYGVEVDFIANTFTRLDQAAGRKPGAGFDHAGPFMRRRCNLADDGTVNAYYGDPGYAEDGSNGQVMVEQPAFYYRVVPLSEEQSADGKGIHLKKAQYYISGTKHRGFKLHPAFTCNNTICQYIYLSAYEACLYDVSADKYILDDAQTADFKEDKLSSIAGAKPMSGKSQAATRANVRTAAHNRGEGWEQSYAAPLSASQLLLLIEYATFDAQTAIGMGVVSKTSDGSSNMSEPTGGTRSLGNASGTAGGGSTVQSVSYRGEENLWGNIWTWADGMNIKNPSTFAEGDAGALYVADHGFADDTAVSPYRDTGIYPCYGDGYISALGYSEQFDWMFIPSQVSGGAHLPVGDYYENVYPGWRTAKLGGKWSDGTEAGAFCWGMANDSSVRYQSSGGRLVYYPHKTHAKPPEVYGVEVDLDTGTSTRLEQAAGKNPGSDFDNAGPFKRRRCNLADDGTVNAYYGDPGYTEDGSNGQVMVEQPAFYYRVEPVVTEPIEGGKGKPSA